MTGLKAGKHTNTRPARKRRRSPIVGQNIMRGWTIEDVERIQARINANIQRRPSVPAPHLERAPCRQPMATPRHPKVDTPCRIHLHCRRHRLADSDGISAKAVIDGLVLAGILRDDSAKQIVKSPTITQEKVGRDVPEETIVEIYRSRSSPTI